MTDKEESFFRKRITELRDTCFQRNIPTHSVFLNADEQAILRTMRLSAGGVRMVTAGGLDDAERRVVFFLPAYLEEIPDDVLCYLKIAPAAPKFADALTHRDFLGALMSLGIRREMLGDICIADNAAHLTALSSVEETICRELTGVKHTTVTVTPERLEDVVSVRHTEERSVNAASLRIDSLISAVWGVSRSASKELLMQGKVAVNSAIVTDGADTLSLGDILSLRGKGRFRLLPGQHETRKGRLSLRVEVWI